MLPQYHLPSITTNYHGRVSVNLTFAAEAGATERQLMAIFGWKDPALARRYTEAASKKKLTEGSIHMLSGGTSEKPKKNDNKVKGSNFTKAEGSNFSEKTGTPPLLGTKWRPLRDSNPCFRRERAAS